MRVVGYLQGPPPDGVDCERPLLVAVSSGVLGQADYLEWREVWRCSNHRESLCGPCATRYRRRVESVAGEGLWQRGGFFYLATVTAPGTRPHCKRAGCDGDGVTCPHERCRCTPSGGVSLGDWNPTAGARWNVLRTALAKHYRVRLQYFRAVEVQDGKRRDDGEGRGALHLHVLVWSPRRLDLRTLRRLAMGAGFGHSVKLDMLTPGSKAAARYVAKYVTKSADDRELVPWIGDLVDPDSGVVYQDQVTPTYRTWSQSAKWGTTMAAIRTAARRKWLTDETERLGTQGISGGVRPLTATAGASPPG